MPDLQYPKLHSCWERRPSWRGWWRCSSTPRRPVCCSCCGSLSGKTVDHSEATFDAMKGSRWQWPLADRYGTTSQSAVGYLLLCSWRSLVHFSRRIGLLDALWWRDRMVLNLLIFQLQNWNMTKQSFTRFGKTFNIISPFQLHNLSSLLTHSA